MIMEVEEGRGSLRLSHAEGVEQKSVSVEGCCVARVCLASVWGEKDRDLRGFLTKLGHQHLFLLMNSNQCQMCFFPPRHLLPSCLCFAPSEVLKSMRRKKHCDCYWYTEGLCSRKL